MSIEEKSKVRLDKMEKVLQESWKQLEVSTNKRYIQESLKILNEIQSLEHKMNTIDALLYHDN